MIRNPQQHAALALPGKSQAQAQAQVVAQAEQAASAAQKLGSVQTGPAPQDNAVASVLDAFTGYT